MITIPSWGWIAFGALVAVLLAADLIAYRRRKGDERAHALRWSVIWIGAGLLFNVFVWIAFGSHAAQGYLAAYLIEKSLSLDNLFMFMVIFGSLSIPGPQQHRVLFWGIIGAVIFRAAFVFLGATALEQWDWITYIFGGLLVLAAIRALRENPSKQAKSRIVAWLSKHLPVSKSIDGGKFMMREKGALVATPLLIALVAIELSDIVFAIDSVPAALSMTRNRFLVYSSNIFAILGLRALYLLVAEMIARLRYIRFGLAAVLGFAGLKMIADQWIEIPPLVSTAIILGAIGITIWASRVHGPNPNKGSG